MAKRKKKNEMDIPESENLFTPKQIDYLARAAKMIPWEVDIQFAQINVPPNDMQQAEDHLTVRHLVSDFGFAVQATIHCPPPKKIFDPKMTNRIKEAVVPIQEYISIGDKYRVTDYKGTHLADVECVKIVAETAYMKAIGQMANAVPTSIDIIKDMVKRRAWTKI